MLLNMAYDPHVGHVALKSGLLAVAGRWAGQRTEHQPKSVDLARHMHVFANSVPI